MKPDTFYGIEVEADYGHFRKSFTTSSPLTHGVPPRTTVAGFLGAILGLPRGGDKNYHNVFSKNNSGIAVVNKPKKSTQKQTINLNLLKVKGETEKLVKLEKPPKEIIRSQVPFEVIKNPRYRIYFNSSELDGIKSFLEEEKSVFTPCLGISEYIADYRFLGKFDVEENEGEAVIRSIVPNKVNTIFEKNKRYIKENFSMFMNQEREVTEFGEVIYEENGKGIKIDGRYLTVNNENVMVLE